MDNEKWLEAAVTQTSEAFARAQVASSSNHANAEGKTATVEKPRGTGPWTFAQTRHAATAAEAHYEQQRQRVEMQEHEQVWEARWQVHQDRQLAEILNRNQYQRKEKYQALTADK